MANYTLWEYNHPREVWQAYDSYGTVKAALHDAEKLLRSLRAWTVQIAPEGQTPDDLRGPAR